MIVFYHNSPNSLPVNKTDDDPEKKKKLLDFRNFVQRKLCKPWESKEQLGAIASRSMIQLMKSHPRIGWVRADQITNEENLKELLSVKRKIEELKTLISDINKYNIDLVDLASGDDKIELSYYVWMKRKGEEWNLVKDNDNFTSNEIFDCIAPRLTLGIASSYLSTLLNRYLNNKLAVKHKKDIEDLKEFLRNERFSSVKLRFSEETINTIKIQLTALGFIIEKQERREKQNIKFLVLTDLGQKEMIKRRAVRKSK